MGVIAFDTLKFVQRLEAAGMAHEQAVALAEAQREIWIEADAQVATKADIVRLESAVDAKLAEVKSSLVVWVAGMLIAQAALVATLVRLL